MGMIACYTMVDDTELSKLIDSASNSPEALIDSIEEINETHETLDIDKYWDGLHFLLTGISASEPLEDDPISEAVVGVANLNEDDFIAYIRHEELQDITDALSDIDFSKLKTVFAPALLKKADIYPNIWQDSDKDALFAELENVFNNLLLFYKQAILERMNIVISIY